MDRSRVIHCIGDSHASFFAGYDILQPIYPASSINRYQLLRAYRLGAVLAYSLWKNNTKEKGRELLFKLLDSLPRRSDVLLCFGEIDNRCHTLKQAELQNKPLNDVIKDIIDKYFFVIAEIRQMGFNVLIFGVLPSCDSFNPDYPTIGTMVERNYSTWLFNNALQKKCLEQDIIFINLFKHLTTKDLKTKTYFFFDNVHLGHLAFPLFIKELEKYELYKRVFKKSTQLLLLKMMVTIRLLLIRRFISSINKKLPKILIANPEMSSQKKIIKRVNE